MKRNDQEFMVQEIRSKYVEKESTQLDELKALDKKVKRPAEVFAYIFGSLGAIVMGSGMSLIMTDIGDTLGIADPMLPGVAVGILGLIVCVINYPIFKKTLASRRNKFADKIIKLSDKLLGE